MFHLLRPVLKIDESMKNFGIRTESASIINRKIL